MPSIEQIITRGHEQVSVFHDAEAKITAIIAVHDTTLGPGLGGCRQRDYPSLDAALEDVLRLSEAMTYKSALAGLNLGGGKSVLVHPGPIANRQAVFSRFGHWVHSLAGRYIAAEDMGTTVDDIEIVLRATPFATGRDPQKGGGGDPGPYTARGVFDGISAALARVNSSPDINGRTIAVQGVGAVGERLVRLLAAAGAKLILADTRPESLGKLAQETNAQVVSSESIYDVPCDVFSPCAVGGILNKDTVPRLQCKIVAGAANNQLAHPECEQYLQQRGIVYVPDFAINAGGVILCADEVEEGGFKQSRVDERVARIGGTVGRILDVARESGELPGVVALQMARARIAAARAKRA